ncbi:Molybdenum cofactor guanylyltransferase, partial [hydrothermal vent metagenome]
GTSSRMGENKALLPFGEKRVIEHITDLMRSIFTEVILITNTPEEYDFLDIAMFLRLAYL